MRVLIIGGGIVGLGTAYQFRKLHPDLEVTVLEKEPRVGQHQSTHNSGVLHCGLYYKPGSTKARLAVEGIRKMVSFCQENKIPHEICGKLVVATNQQELENLNFLLERGRQNGLRGLRWMKRNEFLEIEPHAAGLAAVHVPEEGIVDYRAVCDVLEKNIIDSGGKVVINARVTKIVPDDAQWILETEAGEFRGDFIVNCSGLHCDRVSELAGEKREARIVPFRGEYYQLKPHAQKLVRNLIYPVPDPTFPFLGVHFTRLIEGGIEAGPNAILATSREGYRKTDFNFADLYDALTFPGLWRFLKKYPKMSWMELHRSFSKKIFCQSLQKLVPDVQENDLEPGGAGVRAQAMLPAGELIHDFHFVERKNALHVLNAPSPAATASLAIGEEIVKRVMQLTRS